MSPSKKRSSSHFRTPTFKLLPHSLSPWKRETAKDRHSDLERSGGQRSSHSTPVAVDVVTGTSPGTRTLLWYTQSRTVSHLPDVEPVTTIVSRQNYRVPSRLVSWSPTLLRRNPNRHCLDVRLPPWASDMFHNLSHKLNSNRGSNFKVKQRDWSIYTSL